MHFLFPLEAHLIKANRGIPGRFPTAVKGRYCGYVPGPASHRAWRARACAYVFEGEIRIDDIRGLKVQGAGDPTEDTSSFPAYGAQIVHMPFGSVYTSLQTVCGGRSRKRRHRLPGHKPTNCNRWLGYRTRANNSLVWERQIVNSRRPEHQVWGAAAADEVTKTHPEGDRTEHQSQERRENASGVKGYDSQVRLHDRGRTLPNKLAKELSARREIKNLIRAITTEGTNPPPSSLGKRGHHGPAYRWGFCQHSAGVLVPVFRRERGFDRGDGESLHVPSPTNWCGNPAP